MISLAISSWSCWRMKFIRWVDVVCHFRSRKRRTAWLEYNFLFIKICIVDFMKSPCTANAKIFNSKILAILIASTFYYILLFVSVLVAFFEFQVDKLQRIWHHRHIGSCTNRIPQISRFRPTQSHIRWLPSTSHPHSSPITQEIIAWFRFSAHT